jgi:hypothetical protein
MDLILVGIVAGCAVVALWVATQRASTIAELEIEEGTMRLVRGGIAPSVLADLRDVVSHAGIRSARVRIVRSTRHARVEFKGAVTAQEAQRIRNVIGNVALAKLVGAPRI